MTILGFLTVITVTLTIDITHWENREGPNQVFLGCEHGIGPDARGALQGEVAKSARV